MLIGGDGVASAALSRKREQYAGPSGIKGLLGSSHVFLIAVFASLGGFVYGCKQELLTHRNVS